MFQPHKENIPCLSSWKEELEDSVSIRASKDDSFILEENLQRLPRSPTRRWQVSWLIYLLLATAGIISIFAAIYISKEKSHTCDGLGEVLDTELRSVQPAIEVEKIRFGGTLGFTENSTLIQIFWDPNTPRYTGDPSDELDARWHSLYQADGVDLRGMEADTIRGKTLEKPGGWSIVSLDVFHQLHCLDMLRQALRPDYYTRHDPEPAYTTHIHHCLDHIRQAVMCHVDVTPLPVLWAEKEDRPLNDFQVEHTCRNFWKVRDWALERDAHKHKYKYNQPH